LRCTAVLAPRRHRPGRFRADFVAGAFGQILDPNGQRRQRADEADLRDPARTDAVGRPFDLAVSAIAIHNLRRLDLIAQCYRGIARGAEAQRAVPRL
jgi:hypothetical protein